MDDAHGRSLRVSFAIILVVIFLNLMFNLVTFGTGDQNQMTYIILIKRFANSFHMHAQTTRPRGAHYGMTGKIFKETFLMRLNEWESKIIESHLLNIF